MLTKRQSNILKLIVERYIKEAKPIGSKIISKTLKCSSATVRNEMAALENAGLLEKLIHHLVEFQVKQVIVTM